MAVARHCALSAVILSGQAGYRAVGGPWWAEFALAALVLLTVCLRIVFPQDSPDKLAWWRDRGHQPDAVARPGGGHEADPARDGLTGSAS